MDVRNKAHYVAVTCIIRAGDRYLICKRSPQEKAFPDKWCVPGGKLQVDEYHHLEQTDAGHWLGVIEHTIAREIREETNLLIKDVDYVSSLVFIRNNGFPTLILSLAASYAGGNVRLAEDELVDHAWVTLEEAKGYDLIDNIWEQIEKVEKKRKSAAG